MKKTCWENNFCQKKFCKRKFCWINICQKKNLLGKQFLSEKNLLEKILSEKNYWKMFLSESGGCAKCDLIYISVYQMGRLCGGAHEISDIKAPLFLHGWVVWVVGWVVCW